MLYRLFEEARPSHGDFLILIFLAALGLNCGMQDPFICGMEDLVP